MESACDEVFVFPLSYAQQRLWFLDQLEPGTSQFNLPLAIRITGELRADVLARCIHHISQRHESLRTTFATVDGEAVQLVHHDSALRLRIVDLRALPSNERNSVAAILAAEEARRPFHLRRAPLVRTTLLQLDDSHYMFLVTLHHIISDAWSMNVFFREMSSLYAAYTRGESSPLAEMPIQYADYAEWQRSWMATEAEKQLAYWKQKLGNHPPELRLRSDESLPQRAAGHGAKRGLMLSQDLADAISALGRREGATLFMTLVAVFDVLLYCYTKKLDVVIGTDIAGRRQAETEGLIGFFVNQLVLRTDLTGNPDFTELLRRVRQVVLESYDHQDLPFDRLVEELNPRRGVDRTPLFQVKIALQNLPTPAQRVAGLTLERVAVDTAAAKSDLLLNVVPSDSGLLLSLAYRTAMFHPSTIDQMLARFESISRLVVADPSLTLDQLQEEVLTAETAQEAKVQQDWATARHHRLKKRLSQPKAIVVEPIKRDTI